MTHRLSILVALALAAGPACLHQPPAPAPTSPAHRYRVPASVGTLVVDAQAFAAFAADVRADAEADVAAGPPAEVERAQQFVLAMLDALDGAWGRALERLDRIRAIEHDPQAQVMTGLSIRIWARAIAAGDDTPDGFRGALSASLAELPVARVRPDLEMLRAMGQAFTPDACRQLVEDNVGPLVHAGTVAADVVPTIVFQRYAAVRLAPVGGIIDEVLAAHGIGLPA